MFENIKASCKLFLLVAWITFWYLPAWIAVKLGKLPQRDRIVQFCSKGILRIIGIRLKVSGALTDTRPLLLVTNHSSYIDVPIVSSCTHACLTPKSEILSWPVIGNIAKLCGSIFIDRRPEKIIEMKKGLQTALAANRAICLFPEATTGNGLHLQPFKSGFFSLAQEEINGHALTIQPACIAYSHIRGLPIGSAQWPSIAWYSDMVLAPHAWELLKLGPIRAEISFLTPVTLQQFGDRKKLAEHCRQVIEERIQLLKSSGQLNS